MEFLVIAVQLWRAGRESGHVDGEVLDASAELGLELMAVVMGMPGCLCGA